jgi:hypothetical protein
LMSLRHRYHGVLYPTSTLKTLGIGRDGIRLKFSSVDPDYMEWLYPQSDHEFFGSESGSILMFEVQDGVVIGFETRGMRAVRLGRPSAPD